MKCPLFLTDFNKIRILSTNFRKKKLKYQIPSKFTQWEPSCSLQKNGWRDKVNSHHHHHYVQQGLGVFPVP